MRHKKGRVADYKPSPVERVVYFVLGAGLYAVDQLHLDGSRLVTI